MYDKADNAASDQPDVPGGCGPVPRVQPSENRSLRQLVFEYVRATGRTARADVARALFVSPGSVTAITSDLIAAGYLREVKGLVQGDTSRGRPRVALEVVPEGRYVIGVKLSDEHHSAVLSDFAGNTMARVTGPTPRARKSLDQMLDELGGIIETLLGQVNLDMANLAGVGVGLPGIVDHDTGIIPWSPLLTETDAPLKSAFEDRFQLPVQIDNDTNVLTVAELWFGAGRVQTDFAVVTIEHGVGMGLVLDSKLFRGTRGMGLELGHIKVQLGGALCRCGQRGCLEAYLGDYALANEASTAAGQHIVSQKSPREMLTFLYNQAENGDEGAQGIFHRAGRFLAIGLANIVQLFDPDLIILSGDRRRYEFLYTAFHKSEMQSMTLSSGRVPTRVEVKDSGDFVWATGASALALSAATDLAFGGAWAA